MSTTRISRLIERLSLRLPRKTAQQNGGGHGTERRGSNTPEGPFAASPNFEYRPQQQRMAGEVARALQEGSHLLVEAGTGVGKSFAYLVPAVLFAARRKKKAIICTDTISLQEQLVERDLPLLKRVLPVDFAYAMLKGRSNYLCTPSVRVGR